MEGETTAVDDWVGVTEGEPPMVLLTLWLLHWELVPLPVASPEAEAHCVPLTVPALLPETRGDAVPVVEWEGVPVTLGLTVAGPLPVPCKDTVDREL